MSPDRGLHRFWRPLPDTSQCVGCGLIIRGFFAGTIPNCEAKAA